MEGEYIGALIHEEHGGIALPRGVEPFVKPDHAHRGLWIDRAHAQGEGVDALQHFRNGKPGHVAHHLAFAHAPGCDARKVAAFVITRVGRGHVGCALVAGEHLELHVREIARHLHGRLHIAEAGGENDLVALHGQVAQYALGVRPFRHIGHMGGLHAATQLLLHLLARGFVLTRPAGFGNWRHVDPCGLDRCLLGRGCLRGCCGKQRKGRHKCGREVFVHGVPLHGSGWSMRAGWSRTGEGEIVGPVGSDWP